MAGNSSGAGIFAPHPTIAGLYLGVTDNTDTSVTDPAVFVIFKSVSPDTTAGTYAHGCIAIVTSDGSGNSVYQNTGTSASPSWTLFDTGTAFQLPTTATDSSTTSGNSLALTMSALTTGSGVIITTSGLSTGHSLNIVATSNSTSGSTSVEPFLLTTTLTGAGGVGGRLHSILNTNVALGGWSNAIKGEVVYGALGKTAGLGSAIVAEMTLSAGTNGGTYAPLEIELDLGAGALTGAATSFIYASANQTGGNTAFDDGGFFFNLAGLTAGATSLLTTGTTFGSAAASLKVKVNSTVYYLGLYSGPITT